MPSDGGSVLQLCCAAAMHGWVQLAANVAEVRCSQAQGPALGGALLLVHAVCCGNDPPCDLLAWNTSTLGCNGTTCIDKGHYVKGPDPLGWLAQRMQAVEDRQLCIIKSYGRQLVEPLFPEGHR